MKFRFQVNELVHNREEFLERFGRDWHNENHGEIFLLEKKMEL